MTGTVHGSSMGGNEYDTTAFQHCVEEDLYIFVAYDDGHFKMTGVTLEDAMASTSPSSHIDRYITTSEENIDLDATIVCSMWDGTLSGYTTNQGSGSDYEVYNVAVSACTGDLDLTLHSILFRVLFSGVLNHSTSKFRPLQL